MTIEEQRRIAKDLLNKGYAEDTNTGEYDTDYTANNNPAAQAQARRFLMSRPTLGSDSGNTSGIDYSAQIAAMQTDINGKQSTLISGTNIKTINNQSLLGSGNITITGGSGDGGDCLVRELDIVDDALAVDDTLTYSWTSQSYVHRNNTLMTTGGATSFSYTTIEVEPGQVFRIQCKTGWDACCYLLRNGNSKVVAYPDLNTNAAVVYDETITIPSGVDTLIVNTNTVSTARITRYTPTGVKVKNDSIKIQYLDPIVKSALVPDIPSLELLTLTMSGVEGKYLNYSGAEASMTNTTYGYYPVNPGEQYVVYGTGYFYAPAYLFYNDTTLVSAYPNTNVGATSSKDRTYITVTIPNGVNRIYLNQRPTNTNEAVHNFLYKIKKYTTETDYSENVLHGKKWCAIGDSFTAGDFTGYVDANGKSGQESDAYDYAWGHYKTYPYFVAKRNHMKIQWLARGGTDMVNVTDATLPFSNPDSTNHNYTLIDSDCDYYTIMFGLNELNLTDGQYGAKTDTTNTTAWGAYNTVLEHILTINPFAKIGIIIADSWMNQKYHDFLVSVAEYWGVPYLDLKDGPIMGIGGTHRACSPTAKSLRNAAFQVTTTNTHPSLKAHEYRSTIVENFLRTL